MSTTIPHGTQRLSELRHGVSRCVEACLNLVFPPRCLLCETDLEVGGGKPSDRLFCHPCRIALRPPTPPTCHRCGARAPDHADTATGCPRCIGRGFRFTSVVHLGSYEGALRRAVLRTKQPAGEPLAAALGRLVCQASGAALQDFAPDALVAVPMHWRRRAARATNGAETIASQLARHLRAPVRGVLRRRRATQPQGGLGRAARLANVRGAFALKPGYDLQGARLIVVDDIMTTGATVAEACRVLAAAGAQELMVAVAARAEGPD